MDQCLGVDISTVVICDVIDILICEKRAPELAF